MCSVYSVVFQLLLNLYFPFTLESGYMAPEYAMEGLYSSKSDVFSFGVLLLEMLTGRKNSGFHLSGMGLSLLSYVSLFRVVAL